ncbi:MAG: M18 family aminopeptidase, partial [Corynebacterium sp.]|nr:M18 family aminopeptidase [Corynebacterium sp.]
MSYTEEFLNFIAASPSSYHAAEEVSRQLREVGFDLQDESEEWSAAPGGHVMVRGGAVAAWYVPQEADKNSGFRIVGSHTDSPGLVLKPTPDFSAADWQQVAVEVYGGALLHTWFDRELTVAGQIVTKDGTRHVVNTGPVLRLPSLAIHLY